MTWFKVDDGFWGHPKRHMISKGAVCLWVCAGSWSASQLTDGHVPEHMLTLLGGTKKEAGELLAASLWKPDDRGGWRFHEWAEYQPTRDDVEGRRSAARERMRNMRSQRGSREQHYEQDENVREPFVFGDANSRNASRPVPSRPVVPSELPLADARVLGPPPEPSPPAGRRKPEIPLPPTWAPTPDHQAQAAAKGIDLAHEAAMFRAHADANDRRQRSWNGAFTTWLGKARPNVVNITSAPRRDQWLDR